MTSNTSRDNSPSNHSLPSNNRTQQSAALQEAPFAFSQPSLTLKPRPNTYSGTNGALAAASTVGTGRREEERLAEGFDPSGQTSRMSMMKSFPSSGVSQTVEATHRSSQSREQSPSYKAARLATSRNTPSRDQRPNRRRPSPLHGIDRPDGMDASQPTDETPTAATASLVKLFESKQNTKTVGPVTQSVRYVTKSAPGIASPTPIRPSKRSGSSATLPLRTSSAKSGPKETTLSDVSTASHVRAIAAVANFVPPAELARSSAAISRQVPEPPAPRRRSKRSPLDGSSEGDGTTSESYEGRPISGIPQPSTTDVTEGCLNEAASSLQTRSQGREIATRLRKRQSSPLLVPSQQRSTALRRPPLSSAKSFDKGSQSPNPLRPSRTTTRSSDSYIPQLTVDSLANAMVASSLASSRAPSPSKPPPLPPPRRHGKSYSLFHHHHSQEQLSRTPSPAKGMRHTMRESLRSDEEVDYRRKKGHIMRKHPHKHHEGDRKRYRNQVTDRERKRYEGVWAANKGLWMELDSADCVLNIVVRDIWSRSRLPDDVLEEIWDLVDARGNGRLGREEFVVGLWLVDSRLKGNKLPPKVSEGMWASVRRLTGVKVPHHRR
ncbi:hypothetical protein N7G274_009820 [Stereocaulon virgatum]|uniref:EH domain-containing protein n=1 Tax=Stereocaulon virgatum TaxID=373712 RepID=A0ABR3ZWJ5_9LECA